MHSLFDDSSLSVLPRCQVGEDNVHTALSLVGYESDLRKAMEYVFGSTLVCDTLDNAKKVAFDKQVMTKTVTLGGDIFDPQGTLSGGENNKDHVFVSDVALKHGKPCYPVHPDVFIITQNSSLFSKTLNLS